MKKTGNSFLLFMLLLCAAYPTFAQSVTLKAPQDSIDVVATRHRADITVSSFQNIVGAQFNLQWDSTLFSLDSVGNFGLKMSKENFGLQAKATGLLSFQWYDEALKGVSLANGATMFSLYFTIKGVAGDSSPIKFVDTPTNVREVADITFKAIPASYQDGFLKVMGSGTTANREINPAQLRVINAYPNPFPEEVSITWYANQADQFLITVTDARGREVFRQQQNVTPGEQQLRLGRNSFSTPGTYLLRLQSSRYISTQPLIYAPSR
ncbi:MAG: T9SS type A sorting domain-containing protein [Lewinellaceae bacterium]|nr:T9SS type A sorting domain-containing protein [Lewinellaceae bacterium]